MTWNIETSCGNESSKIRYEIAQYTRGCGLDLGCGSWKTYPHFIGLDQERYPGVDIVRDCTDLAIFATKSLDFVFASHLLEDLKDTQGALREWWRVIKPTGHLVLYIPHKNFYPNVGEKGANPNHKHDFLPDDIIEQMKKMGGWDLLVNEERNQADEYSFFQVFRKRNDKEQNRIDLKRKPEKRCGVVRYGGFGDMIQASSILPGLKERGYHITFYTTPRGHNILKTDPHVDEFFLQDTDQVPNQELTAFWRVQEKKYDKWINLSESVEGTFLAMDGRANHMWPHNVRHLMLNVNYLEFTHALADIPFPPKQRFYTTKEERTWAEAEYRKIGGPLILWTLAGSSPHKTWPYLDQVIASLLLETDFKIVLVGDEVCQLLERGWEKEPRVIRRSGVWDIRKSLAFSLVSDMVIGPETGIMNCVGLLTIPKIVLLSHSSVENLTKHWNNTIPLFPEGCECYPCHKLHHSFEFCKRDTETGTAMCQTMIPANSMFEAIKWHMGNMKLKGVA